jgi:DNA-binding transcriptional ArsR family regulator
MERSPEVVLGALADKLRLELLEMLRERPASTSELAARLDRPKGTVGHHLKVLERAGLVRVVRTRRVRAVTEKSYGPARDELSTFGVMQARLLEADAEHFVRRLNELVDEFGASGSRTGRIFTFVAGLYADGRTDA